MGGYGIDELAIETSMVLHVEQITGGAALDCQCGAAAVLYITSEPDMEPGPVCREHGFQWIAMATSMLRQLFPPEGVA